MAFTFAGKQVEHLKSREILCFRRPKSLNLQKVGFPYNLWYQVYRAISSGV